MSTSIQIIAQFAQSAINSIALEAASKAASQALKGEEPNAWAAASSISSACHALAHAPSSKAVIFGIAARQASDSFAKSRIEAGATEKASKWLAFSSACSIAKSALDCGVWFDGIGKSEASKAVKESREATDSQNYQLAVDAGIVPAQSTPESLNLSLTRELVEIKTEHDSIKSALAAAQERLIPIDALKTMHKAAMDEQTKALCDALDAITTLKDKVATLEAQLATRKLTKVKGIKA